MIRTLLIIAGAALVLAIASLGGAFALGGSDLRQNGWTWTVWDDGHENVRWQRQRGKVDAGPEVTRTLAWTGGDTLTLGVPATVEYRQGAQASVVVTGPQKIVERLTLTGGRLDWDGSDSDGDRVTIQWDRNGIRGWSDLERVKVVVIAPNVSRFEIEGSGDLDIDGYDQPSLAIDISGSGDVIAKGRTRSLSLDISGSGEADLSSLQAVDAKVEVAGSGEARVYASGAADLSIAGSGDITVVNRPASLRQSVTGSGDIDVSGG